MPEATVVGTTAEEMSVADSAFDVAVVATAVHWLDLDVVVPKLHGALVPGGGLAIWRHVFGDPDIRTPFRERVRAIVTQRETPQRRPSGLDTSALSRQLTSTGRFVETHVEHFRWSIDLDADQVRDLFTTFSDWTAAEAGAAAQAVTDLGGRVTEHYLTPLLVLRRVDVPT